MSALNSSKGLNPLKTGVVQEMSRLFVVTSDTIKFPGEVGATAGRRGRTAGREREWREEGREGGKEGMDGGREKTHTCSYLVFQTSKTQPFIY